MWTYSIWHPKVELDNDERKRYHTRKSSFHQSPPLPSPLSLQCIVTETLHILKMREGWNNPSLHRVFCVPVTYSELFADSSSEFSALLPPHFLPHLTTRPHPLELHIFMYPLLSGRRVQNATCSHLSLKPVNWVNFSTTQQTKGPGWTNQNAVWGHEWIYNSANYEVPAFFFPSCILCIKKKNLIRVFLVKFTGRR